MGYDFMFMTLRDAEQRQFPLDWSEEMNASSTSDLPWLQFRKWLLSAGGRVNGEENSIWVDYAEGGNINFAGDESSIFLDCHSSWSDILTAYRFLRSIHPGAVIFDCQDGQAYDEASFIAFMRENGHDP